MWAAHAISWAADDKALECTRHQQALNDPFVIQELVEAANAYCTYLAISS
jgi:hypothetical protein